MVDDVGAKVGVREVIVDRLAADAAGWVILRDDAAVLVPCRCVACDGHQAEPLPGWCLTAAIGATYPQVARIAQCLLG